MDNALGRIIKVFAVVGVLVLAVLLVLFIAGVIKGVELQEGFWKAIEIIATITVASIVVVFITSLGNKKN